MFGSLNSPRREKIGAIKKRDMAQETWDAPDTAYRMRNRQNTSEPRVFGGLEHSNSRLFVNCPIYGGHLTSQCCVGGSRVREGAPGVGTRVDEWQEPFVGDAVAYTDDDEGVGARPVERLTRPFGDSIHECC